MKQPFVHSPSTTARPWQVVSLLVIATTLIVIALQGIVVAATCTSTVFSGASFTVDDVVTGRGSGTASISGCDGDITSISVTLDF